ncbi:hypothetical protein Tco_0513407, partial [Tanacetum coccineum]
MKTKWAMMGRNNAMACVGDGNRLAITNVLISTKEEPTVPIPLAMIGLLVDWWLPVVDLKSTIASRSSKHRMQASNLESVNEKDK